MDLKRSKDNKYYYYKPEGSERYHSFSLYSPNIYRNVKLPTDSEYFDKQELSNKLKKSLEVMIHFLEKTKEL